MPAVSRLVNFFRRVSGGGKSLDATARDVILCADRYLARYWKASHEHPITNLRIFSLMEACPGVYEVADNMLCEIALHAMWSHDY